MPPVFGRFVIGPAVAVGTIGVGVEPAGWVGCGVGVGARVSTNGTVVASPGETVTVEVSSAYGAAFRTVSG